jgi:CRISPR system Cascade subunit CasA
VTPSFNLVDQPWIPCLPTDGKVVEFSLRDLFEKAHELIDLAADSPMENAALYRFLLAILHRNLGPANSREWQKLWEADTFPVDVLNGYFAEWYDRFDLFSLIHPFYQSLDDIQLRSSLVDFRHGTGFTPNIHFNHEATGDLLPQYTPAKAARVLLATQNFGFGGGYHGEHSYAPCASGIIFLVAGDNVKETLLLNLTNYPTKDDIFEDLPAWEMGDAYELDRTEPSGKLDYLTWQNRRIFLATETMSSGDVLVTDWSTRPGLKLNKDQSNFMSHYLPGTKGYYSLSFEEDKLLWRNSYSLLTLEDVTGHLPPKTIQWIRYLVAEGRLPLHRSLKCRALGLQRSNANAEFARQDQFPLPLSLLINEKKLSMLRDAIDRVERTSSVLDSALALTSMHLHLGKPENYNWKKKRITHSGAEEDLSKIKTTEAQVSNWVAYTGSERHFWAALDVPFLNFMEQLGAANEVDLTDVSIWWQHQIRVSTENAFHQVLQYTNQTARAFKAYAHGNNRLQGYLNKNFPIKEKRT